MQSSPPSSIDLPSRLLLGPGPSNISERVRRALAQPMIGHLDPAFLRLLDQVQDMLRRVFGTHSALTLPLSATGSAGMECCLINLTEPGERVLIGQCGVFGGRMRSIVERMGAQPIVIEAPMGQSVSAADMIAAIESERPHVVALVHAETSTGVAQPIPEIARAARARGALMIVDCVTSLSGMPFEFDAWEIDAAYSGTQKCISCPPGLSPIAIGPRALERLAARRTPVQSWYLDLGLIGGYLGSKRVYHHTAPISSIFALHAGLSAILEEGLTERFQRHAEAHQLLVHELRQLGFEFLVREDERLPMLNAVIPPYADEGLVRRRLLLEHGIEVGGGLGSLAGKIWRIGLMGENARAESVTRLVDALRKLG